MQIPSIIGYYAIGEKIGEGNYAEVKCATHAILKCKVALKIINKSSLCASDMQKIYREVKINKVLQHPNIIRLYQVMEHKKLLYMVTEYASGGELFSYLSKHHSMTESDARNVFSQLISALEFCHSHNIVHRDIKLENLLLDRHGNVKLADFGFSNFFSLDGKLNSWCGSPSYAAPEIFEGRAYVGPEVDIWSAGVVLYTLVSGCLPFDGCNVQELKQRVIKRIYRLHFRISEDCGDLIRNMIVYESSKRYTIPKIRAHRWMQKSDQSLATKLTGADEVAEVREHIARTLKSKGVDWHAVLESANNRKFDDFYGMYSILEDQYISEIRSNDNKPPVVSAETRALPSVGFPELRQQQEILKQARDWTCGDLAKVPSSLSSRSSLGSSQLEPMPRMRTISGQHDAQLALHQQYLNYRRHSLDIFTFQNPQLPNSQLTSNTAHLNGPHLSGATDGDKPQDLLSRFRAYDFTVRRASDSIALQSLQYNRLLAGDGNDQTVNDANYNYNFGNHNYLYHQQMCKNNMTAAVAATKKTNELEKQPPTNKFLSSIPNRINNQGRRFSDGLITFNQKPNLDALQEMPGHENDSEEMLPIPSSFQLSPRQPLRRHSMEPSILTPVSGKKTAIQQHLQSLYEQAIYKNDNDVDSSSSSGDMNTCENQMNLGSRLKDLHLASNHVEQWQKETSAYMDCIDMEVISPEVEVTSQNGIPRQVSVANIVTDQTPLQILNYVESYLIGISPTPCLNTEGFSVRACWNELEIRAEVCSVGCKNGVQLQYIRGDQNYYQAVSSQLLSSFHSAMLKTSTIP